MFGKQVPHREPPRHDAPGRRTRDTHLTSAEIAAAALRCFDEGSSPPSIRQLATMLGTSSSAIYYRRLPRGRRSSRPWSTWCGRRPPPSSWSWSAHGRGPTRTTPWSRPAWPPGAPSPGTTGWPRVHGGHPGHDPGRLRHRRPDGRPPGPPRPHPEEAASAFHSYASFTIGSVVFSALRRITNEEFATSRSAPDPADGGTGHRRHAQPADRGGQCLSTDGPRPGRGPLPRGAHPPGVDLQVPAARPEPADLRGLRSPASGSIGPPGPDHRRRAVGGHGHELRVPGRIAGAQPGLHGLDHAWRPWSDGPGLEDRIVEPVADDDVGHRTCLGLPLVMVGDELRFAAAWTMRRRKPSGFSRATVSIIRWIHPWSSWPGRAMPAWNSSRRRSETAVRTAR